MNFQDTRVTCESCGKEFIFTVEAQRQMADKGLEVVEPNMCSTCTQRIEYGGRLHGHVKWFSLEKGYGFLVQDDGGEIFFHRSSVSATEETPLTAFDEGQEVLYEVEETAKGPAATNVEPYEAV